MINRIFITACLLPGLAFAEDTLKPMASPSERP